MAETNALPTGAPQAAPIENSSPLDQAPAHNPILDIGGYNPMPDSVGISTQIKGSPITGINPGLKDPLGTKDFAKSIGNYISNVSISQQDPHEQMKPFSYNGDFDGANFERYFGTKQFNKLGFNPYRDNDALYNDNRTFGDDFTRAASQWPSLFKSGFMSGIRSWGDMFSDPLAPDIKTAREMQKAMAIGSSTKGGVGAFINNTFLNSAYTVGIGAELLIEELALAGITAVTGGSAGAFSLPAMLARGTKAGRLATESVKVGEEVLGAMKNLNKMSDLRTFWNTTGKAAGKIGGALNPLENTWEIGKELAYGTNALKFTKAGGKIDEFARVSSNFGRFAKDMILVKSAVSEAKLEGGMVQMDVTKDLMEKYRAEHDGLEPEGEEMVKIQNIAKEEAKRTALWNLPAIMWSNKLMYETIFAPFERGAQNVTKDIIMGTTKEGKKVFKQLGDGLLERAAHTGKSLLQPKAYGKFAMGYMKANLAEGVQENLQEAISMGAKEHAKAVYTNENRGVYEGYMGHFLTGLKGQFSAEGAETFAGGLLMGAMAQPMMSAPMALSTKAWDATLGKKKYQEYRQKRDEQVQATVATLNELYDDPMKFFAPDLANLVTQDELAVDMHHAVEDGRKKDIKDINHIATFEHIHTALTTGHYDTIMDQIKEMKNLTPEEAAGLLPEGTDPKQGTKVLESIDTILKRAEEIKSNFDEVNANYPNPFDPNRFTKGTVDYNSQALAYHAWNKAQKNLIFAKESFNDHSRRLEEMATALSSTSRPLEKTSAQDFMVLLDPRLTNETIKSLAMDIRNLDPSDREQSKLITDKTKQLNHLADIKAAFENERDVDFHYTLHGKPGLTKVGNTKIPVGSYIKIAGQEEPHFVTDVITSAKGRVTGYKIKNLSTDEETTISAKKASYIQSKNAKTLHADLADTKSRKAFSAYLRHLSKKNGDFFFNDKVEKAYGIIKDHMLLKDEQQYLAQSINVLNNPKGFLRLAQDLEGMNKQVFDAKKEILDKNAREFLVRVESNNGVNTLMKKTGLVPTEDYWDYFVETIRKGNEPLLPTEFLDSKTLEEVKEGEKFDQGLETWKDVLEMIKKEEIKEPEGIKPVAEVQGKAETKPEVKPEVKEKVVSDMETVMQQYNTGKLPNETISAIDDILDNDDTYSSLDEPTEAQKLQAFEDNKVQILSLVKPKEEAKIIIDAQTTKPKVAAPEEFAKTSATTETSSTPQKKAEAAIKKLKEDTKGVKPTEEGYRIKGDLYELRVSTAAGRVVGKEFAFSTTDKGKKVLGIYDRMKRDKDFTPKDFVAKLKKDPTTSSLFEEVKSRTTGKITVRFSEDKANSIVEALTAEDSRANLIKTLDAVAYKDATDRGNTVDGIARDFFDKGSAEKPDNITQEAFDDLIKQLTALRTEIETNGDIILTNGLIVYGEDESVKDRGIAGEMDLLVITPDGKYKIYDIKTNDSWKGYVGDKRDGHAAQLSLYQNLLEHITGIPVVERRIIPIKTTTDPNGVVTDIEDPFSKTNLEPNDLILPYDSRVEEYVSKPEIKAEVLVKGKPITTEDKIAKIRRDIETAPDLIALDKAYDNNAKIVQELLEEEDKILEEEELEFETESVLFKINELMAEKRQELVKDAKNVNNLRWAAQNGATVNFDTLTEVGTDYIPQVPKKDTIKVTKLGLDYTIPVTSITSINLPGELAPQVIITEEDEKVISETDKAVKELADDPVAAAKKIAEKLKLSDDELDNEAKCNNH